MEEAIKKQNKADTALLSHAIIIGDSDVEDVPPNEPGSDEEVKTTRRSSLKKGQSRKGNVTFGKDVKGDKSTTKKFTPPTKAKTSVPRTRSRTTTQELWRTIYE